MQFQVPQFIDVEDKIIGPFGLKQFLYLAGAGATVFVLLLLFTPVVALVIASPIVAVALALAFYKINGRDFLFFLNSISKYFLGPRLYTWQRETHEEREKKKVKEKKPETEEKLKAPPPKPLPIEKKLKKLAWQLDIMKHDKQ